MKKLEKMFKDEERRWEDYEDQRVKFHLIQEREREKLRIYEDTKLKRIKRLIESDLNYDSDVEKAKIKKNPKKYDEYKLLRQRERYFKL